LGDKGFDFDDFEGGGGEGDFGRFFDLLRLFDFFPFPFPLPFERRFLEGSGSGSASSSAASSDLEATKGSER